MVETSAPEFLRDSAGYLEKVERGETVLMRKNGRAVARLVPGSEWMEGEDFARLFNGYHPDALDKAAADEIERNIPASPINTLL